MSGSENSTAIMFFYVYILQSVNSRSLYIGYTTDLTKRLQEHNRGLNFFDEITETLGSDTLRSIWESTGRETQRGIS